jgi:hypothetical protein
MTIRSKKRSNTVLVSTKHQEVIMQKIKLLPSLLNIVDHALKENLRKYPFQDESPMIVDRNRVNALEEYLHSSIIALANQIQSQAPFECTDVMDWFTEVDSNGSDLFFCVGRDLIEEGDVYEED